MDTSYMHLDSLRVLQAVRDRNSALLDDVAKALPDLPRKLVTRKLLALVDQGYLDSRRFNGGKLRAYTWTGKAPAQRKHVVDPALVVATVDRLVPDIVPQRTLSVLFTNAEPDKRLPYRADAFDFLRCHSRIGDQLVPMTRSHHDPR